MARLTKIESGNYNKYHTPGCGNLIKRKVNAVFIHISTVSKDHKQHEMAKCDKAYDLMQSGSKIVTEAVRNKKDSNGKARRVDLVDLTTGIEYEFETQIKRARRFLGEEGVKMIHVGWSQMNIAIWRDLEKEFMEKKNDN